MASSNSNKKEWSKDQTIDLIEKYEENSVLWDHKSKEYRNREKNKVAKLLSIIYSFVSLAHAPSSDLRIIHGLTQQFLFTFLSLFFKILYIQGD
jgi:hypothetical protein